MPIRDSQHILRPPRRPFIAALLAFIGFGLSFALPAVAEERAPPPVAQCAAPAAEHPLPKPTTADNDAAPTRAERTDAWSDGSVTVGGAKIDYCAVAGTLVVHPKDWDDAADSAVKGDSDDNPKHPTAWSTVFYVAYFKRGSEASARPITFLFNGGPGSATLWLHMGAFGPKRVETANDTHSAAAPYRLVNNDQSLLDASDLVFIDAPGTGFSRISGPDKDKAFFGIDQDAHAFAAFITAYLTKYQRWNSPKYLFGESYGTTRAAVLVNLLQDDPGVDFNGVIMLSEVLFANLYPDQPKTAPGNDLPYQLGLPTYAATAWYHQQPADQRSTPVPASLLGEVERFATGDYAAALAAGASLDQATRDAVVAKLHAFTGLSEDYLRRADLRVSPDEFRQELLRDRGLIVGGTDTRFEGHTLDRISSRSPLRSVRRSNRLGFDKPALEQNQFGADIGGPLKRGKIFLFGDYEGFRRDLRAAQTATVPTTAQASGQFVDSLGNPIPITNPYTKAIYANGVIPIGALRRRSARNHNPAGQLPGHDCPRPPADRFFDFANLRHGQQLCLISVGDGGLR